MIEVFGKSLGSVEPVDLWTAIEYLEAPRIPKSVKDVFREAFVELVTAFSTQALQSARFKILLGDYPEFASALVLGLLGDIL